MVSSGTPRATRPLYLTGKRSTLLYWPEAVDERLNTLHQLIAAAGGQASRAQILAALVMAAARDGDQLDKLVRWYRRLDEAQTDLFPPAGMTVRRSGHRRPSERSTGRP
jgi:hypothetical protein